MRPKKWLLRIVPWLGSLRLAVVLLMTLAAVIAVATVLEADHDRAYAQWYVYHSRWFMVLLGLLGINIFFAAASRWPWKRHHTGFVVTHAGLLVLLVGSVQSFVGGVEGQVTLAEGEAAAKMIVPRQTQITASWQGKPDEAPYFFSFEAGPTDWDETTTLDLGDVDGISARVLRYYANAKAKEDWVRDETGAGGPAVKFKVDSPHGGGSEEYLLTDQDYGDETFVGPIRVQLRRAVSQAMVDDFLNPPTNLGKKGLLLAYYKNRVKHIAVDANVGKKVLLDESGAAVEIVEYLANAKPDMKHQFHSAGDEPRNPLLELRVHEPGRKSLRQLAFAKSPLLNLDPMLGQTCPVQFHYLHPAVKSEAALELLQSGDGQLFYRVIAGQKSLPQGKVTTGTRVPVTEKFAIAFVEYLPHARQRIVFEPQPADGNSKEKAEAAAEIEITAGGATQTIWLQRNHAVYGTRSMVTPKGVLTVRLGPGEVPLRFSLKLAEFRKGVNPGGVGNATFSSVVQLVDKDADIDEERVISMNEPLTHKGLTFYQSGFNEAGHGIKTSTFSVGRDPGRWVKYGGCSLICLGIAIMFYMRAYFFKRTSPPPTERETVDQEKPVLEARLTEASAPCSTDEAILAGVAAEGADSTPSGEPRRLDFAEVMGDESCGSS